MLAPHCPSSVFVWVMHRTTLMAVCPLVLRVLVSDTSHLLTFSCGFIPDVGHYVGCVPGSRPALLLWSCVRVPGRTVTTQATPLGPTSFWLGESQPARSQSSPPSLSHYARTALFRWAILRLRPLYPAWRFRVTPGFLMAFVPPRSLPLRAWTHVVSRFLSRYYLSTSAVNCLQPSFTLFLPVVSLHLSFVLTGGLLSDSLAFGPVLCTFVLLRPDTTSDSLYIYKIFCIHALMIGCNSRLT